MPDNGLTEGAGMGRVFTGWLHRIEGARIVSPHQATLNQDAVFASSSVNDETGAPPARAGSFSGPFPRVRSAPNPVIRHRSAYSRKPTFRSRPGRSRMMIRTRSRCDFEPQRSPDVAETSRSLFKFSTGAIEARHSRRNRSFLRSSSQVRRSGRRRIGRNAAPPSKALPGTPISP